MQRTGFEIFYKFGIFPDKLFIVNKAFFELVVFFVILLRVFAADLKHDLKVFPFRDSSLRKNSAQSACRPFCLFCADLTESGLRIFCIFSPSLASSSACLCMPSFFSVRFKAFLTIVETDLIFRQKRSALSFWW